MNEFNDRLLTCQSQSSSGDLKMQQDSYHHGDLRNSLVSIGTELLNNKGISSISLREIARTIGVGHNAPYRHFRNKQQLLEAIAEAGFRQLVARNTRLELEFAHDPESQLFESGMHVISMAAEKPNLFELMFGGYLQPGECGSELKQASDEAMKSLVRIIQNGQKQQQFIGGDPMKLALGAMSMIQGLAMMVSSGKLRVHSQQARTEPGGWSQHPNLLRGMVLQLFDVFLLGIKIKG